MNYIIDLLFVAIVALSILRGWKAGFIKTVMHLIINLLSFVIAFIFASPISMLFRDNILPDYPTEISHAAAYIIAFAVIYVVAHIGIAIATSILDIISKLPILNFTNKSLGIAMGGVLGLVYAWIFAIILNYAYPMLNSHNPEIFTEDILQSSILFPLIFNVNILKYLFDLIGL